MFHPHPQPRPGCSRLASSISTGPGAAGSQHSRCILVAGVPSDWEPPGALWALLCGHPAQPGCETHPGWSAPPHASVSAQSCGGGPCGSPYADDFEYDSRSECECDCYQQMSVQWSPVLRQPAAWSALPGTHKADTYMLQQIIMP